jgi:DNA-binding transcriptional regulator YiaG
MENKNIINKLRLRMQIEGLRQVDVATVLETNVYTVHRWLSGKTEPSPV